MDKPALALKALDVFPKTVAEFRQKTVGGGVVSIACLCIVAALTLGELYGFVAPRTEERLYVDTSRNRPLPIYLDVTFPALPCSVLQFELRDVSGNELVAQGNDVVKQRLDRNGRPISAEALPKGNDLLRPLADKAAQGSARHVHRAGRGLAEVPKGAGDAGPLLAEILSQLLPQLQDDTQAMEEVRSHLGEGCHITATLSVNKVAGNFNVAIDRDDERAVLRVFGDRSHVNMSHVIKRLAFGPSYPGMVNPMSGLEKVIHEGSGYFQYHLKVVPTVYEARRQRAVYTHQYAFTEIFRTAARSDRTPAVHFNYELSAIMARFTKVEQGLGAFLTGLCAIVGGVFTLAGIVDAVIYRATASRAPGLGDPHG